METGRKVEFKDLHLSMKVKIKKILSADEIQTSGYYEIREYLYLIQEVKGPHAFIILQGPTSVVILADIELDLVAEHDKEDPEFYNLLFTEVVHIVDNAICKSKWQKVNDLEEIFSRIVVSEEDDSDDESYDESDLLEPDSIREAWHHPSGFILAYLRFFDGHAWVFFEGVDGEETKLLNGGGSLSQDDGGKEYRCPFSWATQKVEEKFEELN